MRGAQLAHGMQPHSPSPRHSFLYSRPSFLHSHSHCITTAQHSTTRSSTRTPPLRAYSPHTRHTRVQLDNGTMQSCTGHTITQQGKFRKKKRRLKDEHGAWLQAYQGIYCRLILWVEANREKVDPILYIHFISSYKQKRAKDTSLATGSSLAATEKRLSEQTGSSCQPMPLPNPLVSLPSPPVETTIAAAAATITANRPRTRTTQKRCRKSDELSMSAEDLAEARKQSANQILDSILNETTLKENNRTVYGYRGRILDWKVCHRDAAQWNQEGSTLLKSLLLSFCTL
jgi:hypothetical protein